MKTSHLPSTIAAIVGAIAISSSLSAAIVDSGTLNIPIPQNFDGIYYNVLNNASGSAGATVPGWDLSFYQASATFGITFFWPGPATVPPSAGGVATGTVYQSLAVGSTISAASVFSVASGGGTAANFVNYITAGPKTLGFRFLNETGAVVHYGYVNITTSGPLGFPAVITRIVYDNVAGTPVTVEGTGPAAAITAATAPGPVAVTQTLPAASSSTPLRFNATGAASSITCAATGAGYSVAPLTAVPLVVGTPGTVTVTYSGTVAGTFTGTVTCTGGAGSTGGPFVYTFSTNVVTPLITQIPTLNTWGAMFLLLGVGLLGAFSVRRFS